MRSILDPGGREVLQAYARSNVLLGFDFDGTLAPIVSDPESASIPSSTRTLLKRLSAHFPWVVVSGRSRADVFGRLAGTGVSAVYGNHGLESWRTRKNGWEEVAQWRRQVGENISGLSGVVLEDKGLSLAVHYRCSPAPRAARAAILAAVGRLKGARILGGKQVINVLPEGAGHKGTAILQARSLARCDTVLYAGDDETDEDVFALDQPGRLLAIRVGHHASSEAAYFLPRQTDIDELLRELIAVRSRPEPEIS